MNIISERDAIIILIILYHLRNSKNMLANPSIFIISLCHSIVQLEPREQSLDSSKNRFIKELMHLIFKIFVP